MGRLRQSWKERRQEWIDEKDQFPDIHGKVVTRMQFLRSYKLRMKKYK